MKQQVKTVGYHPSEEGPNGYRWPITERLCTCGRWSHGSDVDEKDADGDWHNLCSECAEEVTTSSIFRRNDSTLEENTMKVVQGQQSNSFEVVLDSHGTTLPGGATYAPLPLCRVPIGYGRDERAAEALANQICALLNRAEADRASAEFWDRR